MTMEHTLYISESQPKELKSNISYIKPRNFCKENEDLSWQDLLVNWVIKDVVINHEWGVYEWGFYRWYVKNYSDLMNYVIEEVLTLLDDDGCLTIITDSLDKKKELLALLHYHERHTFIIQDKFSLVQDYDCSENNWLHKYIRKMPLPQVMISEDRQINSIIDKNYDDYLENI